MPCAAGEGIVLRLGIQGSGGVRGTGGENTGKDGLVALDSNSNVSPARVF